MSSSFDTIRSLVIASKNMTLIIWLIVAVKRLNRPQFFLFPRNVIGKLSLSSRTLPSLDDSVNCAKTDYIFFIKSFKSFIESLHSYIHSFISWQLKHKWNLWKLLLGISIIYWFLIFNDDEKIKLFTFRDRM